MIPDVQQLLRFRVGVRGYALRVEAIKEILPCGGLTRAPRTPPVVRGLINLRGNVATVLDLGQRLGHGSTVIDDLGCILIVADSVAGPDNEIGLLVSAVEVVLTLNPGQLQPPPGFGLGLPQHFVSAMAEHDGIFSPVLELATVVDLDELRASIHEESERQLL